MSIKPEDAELSIADVTIKAPAAGELRVVGSEFETKQPGLPGYVAMNPDGSFTAVPSIDAADLVILPATGDPDEVIIGVHDGIAGSGSLPDANPEEVDLTEEQMKFGGDAGGGKSAPHPGFGKGWPVYASDGQPGDKVEVIFPMEGAVAPGDSTVVTDPARIFRHCGIKPDDDWVKRVERLNAIIDGLNGRGEAVGGAIVGTVVV